MRPKIVLAVVLAGVVGLVAIFYLKHLAAPARPTPVATVTPEIKPATPTVPPAVNSPMVAAPAPAITRAIPVPQAAVDTNALAEEHHAYVQARIDKLQELQANDDAQSLQAILAELTNADKEIREAAIESTIQFSSRDAIPVLQDLAARTTDPEEKKELQDAADFLALPTLSEIRAQNPNAKINIPQAALPAPGQP
jgi:hypothetical protein